MKILVINPGSTSTKLAVYNDLEPAWRESLFHSTEELSVFHHVNEQYAFRRAESCVAVWKSLWKR